MTAKETQHIDRILSAGTKGHSPDQDTVDPIILRSWRRCVSDYGLVPSLSRKAKILSSSELKDHQVKVEHFLHVARTGLQSLHKRVRDLGYVILLCDSSGVTVEYIGNERYDRELREARLYLGADWNERKAGTCGVGICATELKPVTVHQADHFDPRNISLTCTAAPIFDPIGNPLAVLDVSALRSPHEKASQHLLRELVIHHAQYIESANFLEHFQNDCWIVRIGNPGEPREYLNVSSTNLVAFDESGTIVGLNSSARHLISGAANCHDSTWAGAIGKTFSSLFGQPWDNVLHDTIRQESSRIILSGQSGSRRPDFFFAVSSPLKTHKRQHLSRTNTETRRPKIPSPRPNLSFEDLVGSDDELGDMIQLVHRLLDKGISFLIEGETGTGKELFARAIHNASARHDQPFVAVNCAAIPESLIESELFGYAPGTFTGGRSKGKRGLIEQASGGTLFLDEIGDMPLHLQTRLLRVLSEHEITPLGANKPASIQLNVVAATHQDLEHMILEGSFREDLYFRLAGATLRLPPLRKRKDFDHVVSTALQLEQPEQPGSDKTVTPATLRHLKSHDWPGNIRELRNVIKIACAISDGREITPCDLPQTFRAKISASPFSREPTPEIEECEPQNLPEKQTLINGLKIAGWNISAAAKQMGMSRATVYRHMKRLNIKSPNQEDSQ